jgi:hypothetical protein
MRRIAGPGETDGFQVANVDMTDVAGIVSHLELVESVTIGNDHAHY